MKVYHRLTETVQETCIIDLNYLKFYPEIHVMDVLHLVFYNQFLFLSIGPGAVGQLVLLKFC